MKQDVIASREAQRRAQVARSSTPSLAGESDLPEHDHFTLVFEGSLRDIDENPFLTETPFGLPRVVGIGNAFAEFDEFCAERDALIDALRRLEKPAPGVKTLPPWAIGIIRATLAKVDGSAPSSEEQSLGSSEEREPKATLPGMQSNNTGGK